LYGAWEKEMTKKPNRKIILIAYINSHLSEIIPLACFFKNRKYEPIVLYLKDKRYCFEPIKDEFIDPCLKEKIKIINLLREEFVHEKFKKPEEGMSDLIETIRNTKILYWIAQKIYAFFTPIIYMNWLLRWRKYADDLFTKLRPSVLVLPEENQIFQTEIFTKAAKKNGAHTLVFPYTIANSIELAEVIKERPENSLRPIFNKIIAYFHPRWVHEYHGRKLILMPAFKVFITEILHLGMSDPWKLNAGSADQVLVGSEATEEYFLRSGLKKNRLVLTGSLGMDELAKRPFTLSKKPTLLFAFPPSQFPRCNLEFSDYNYLKDFFACELGKIENYQVLVALHPRLDSKEFGQLKEHGLRVANRNILSLIPSCSIFVASISTTIQWAIAAGKPVLNYDVYKYRYHDYDDAKGVITVESKKDFIKYLNKLTADKGYLAEITKLQQSVATKWGRLDGKSGERIMGLVDAIIEKNSTDRDG